MSGRISDGLVDPRADAGANVDKLLTIADALMRQVELSSGERGAAYAQFRRAAALEDRVRQRTPHAAIVADLEPCLVHVDPAGVDHAIGNLIDNAIKWSPEGGTVCVELHRGTVMVADQGEGIDEEDLPHVFERFYRSRESRGMPGSGLGLSIVHATAYQSGGEVRLGRSDLGGARVEVLLGTAA